MSNLITFSADKSYNDKLDKIADHDKLKKSDVLRRLIDEKYDKIKESL